MCFTHLWRSAVAASAHSSYFSIGQRNVLLFQMGKVASSALQMALLNSGVNTFHCHELRHERQAARLGHLFTAEPDLRRAAVELKLLAKHTALNMLVRWYQQHQVAPERKLKVIALTRDPALRFQSALMQMFGYDPSRLVSWHRDFSGNSNIGEAAAATVALMGEVAALTLKTKPSCDLAAARMRGRELAMAVTPPQPLVAEGLHVALHPLDWFEREFTPIFGIGLSGLPELAEFGLVERTHDSVDILVLRYEDLSRHLDALARFVGVPALELPARNVSIDKTYGRAIREAAQPFWASDAGRDFQRELRQTAYGRACGYDRLG